MQSSSQMFSCELGFLFFVVFDEYMKAQSCDAKRRVSGAGLHSSETNADLREERGERVNREPQRKQTFSGEVVAGVWRIEVKD